MGAAGYTLLRDGHVRVDIFYASATPKARSIVDVAGAVTMLIPVCILVWWTAWPYVMASWAVFEGSRETSGIQAVFLLKTVLLVFAAVLGAQGFSMAVKGVLHLAGYPLPQGSDSKESAA